MTNQYFEIGGQIEDDINVINKLMGLTKLTQISIIVHFIETTSTESLDKLTYC